MINIIPMWLKKSIALKVVVLVCFTISCVVAVQTVINTSQVEKKIEPILVKILENYLNKSLSVFKIIAEQTAADAVIIRSDNSLTNYLDFEVMGDNRGMNEEIIAVEQFLRSLVSFKKQYQEIEIITPRGTVVRLKNGLVVAGSEKKVGDYSLGHYYSVDGKEIYFNLNYQILMDEDLGGDNWLVIVRIKNNITDNFLVLDRFLKENGVHISIISAGHFIVMSEKERSGDSGDMLSETLVSDVLGLTMTARIEKKDAFVVVREMKENAIYLAFLVIVVISALLLLTAKIVIDKPLRSIINFINEGVLEKHNLEARHHTSSIDEIGVFSKGLNSMLDQIKAREDALLRSEERLTLALWGGGEGMWDYNFEKNMVYFDKSSCDILGYDEKEVRLSIVECYRRVHPNDIKRLRSYTENFITGPYDSYEIEIRVFIKKHEAIWLLIKGKRIKPRGNGGSIRAVGIVRDVTESRKAEEEIGLYATAFDSTSNACSILDCKFVVLAINKAFVGVTGFSSADVVGKPASFIGESQSASVKIEEINRQIKVHGQWNGEMLDRKKNNETYLQELTLNPVVSGEGKLNNYICVFTDVTDKKKSEEKLWLMANYDILTNLPNRSMFRDSLGASLRKAKRLKKMVGLLFVDLDKFKQVNDSLGHEAGDELLKKVAERLLNVVRETDTVARLGGDEFAIILEGISEKKNVEIIAEKLIDAFNQGFIVENKDAGVGASVGISLYPADAKDPEALLHQADTAMYFSKTSGRNKYSFYIPSMRDETGRRNYLEQELKQALLNDKLMLYYQPQIEIKTGRVVGFEALSRWVHPELGFVSPDEFIPIAEDTGLIAMLGHILFWRAFSQLKKWHNDGYVDLRMAVNVSPRQFLLTDVPIDVAKAIKDTKVEGKYIELELTESLIMDEPEQIILMLNVLKGLGLRLSIDDFGTGYSSLSYLSQFPLDILKIDKSFIHQMGEKKKGLALTQSIIAIAHSLDLEVVAEGVETQVQLGILERLGCEYVQGYYFSAPLPAQEAGLFLRENYFKNTNFNIH